MKHIIAVTLMSSLAFTGCKKKDAPAATGSAGSSAATSAVAKTAEPAKPACAAGMFKAPSGTFCIDPHGYTPGEEKKDDPNMQIEFVKTGDPAKGDQEFKVWYREDAGHGDYQSGLANAATDMKAGSAEGSGDLTGATGKFFLWQRDDIHKLVVDVQGNKNHFVCEASSYKAPVDPDALAACKSLIPTD